MTKSLHNNLRFNSSLHWRRLVNVVEPSSSGIVRVNHLVRKGEGICQGWSEERRNSAVVSSCSAVNIQLTSDNAVRSN